MKRIVFAAFAAAVAAASAVEPYAGYVYPAGICPGQTNRFTIGGQGFNNSTEVWLSGEGLKVVSVERVPSFPNPTREQKKHLVEWLDGIFAGNPAEPEIPEDAHVDEWRTNAWWRALDTLDAGKLAIVERDLHVPKNALQAAPSLRQLLLVTIAADPGAAPGTRSLVVWGNNGMSAPRRFEVSSAPRIEEPDYAPAHRPPPASPPTALSAGEAVFDGTVMPGETDRFRLLLAGSRRYSFSVLARELQPYIGDAVPGFFNPILELRDARGALVARSDDTARFRPDPEFEFVPEADGEFSLEIRDVLFRGRADFVYAINAGDSRPAALPPHDGVVESPGKPSRIAIEIDEPGARELEITARRAGSPLDAVMTIRRSENGEALASWDDAIDEVAHAGSVAQGECDPRATFDFPEKGRYIVEVADRTGHGGPGYFWSLSVRKAAPSFVVRSRRSTLPVEKWKKLPVELVVERSGGFDGPVEIEAAGPLVVSNATIQAGSPTGTVWFAVSGSPEPGVSGAEIFARAEIGGKTLRKRVIPCDEFEQAFAWRHLVEAEQFLMRVVRPKKKAKSEPKKR